MAKRPKVKFEKDIHFVIHGEVQRPWGYEIRVAIFDDEDNHLDSSCITWPRNHGVPSEGQRLSTVIMKLLKYKERRDNPEPEPAPEYFMEQSDLLDFLVQRGHLVQGQSLNDLPDLNAGPVVLPRWRRAWDFLNRPLWGG